MERFATEKALLCSGIAERGRKNLRRCIAEAEKASGDRAVLNGLHRAVNSVRPAKTKRTEGALPEIITVAAGGRKSADFPMREAAPCDGIALEVEYDGRSGDATLTVGVGSDAGFSYIEGIGLPQEKMTFWLTYDLFVPAVRRAERIVVALESDEDVEVRVTPLCFFSEQVEPDLRTPYSEDPVSETRNDRFYKIVDIATGRALALVPRIKETDLRWEQSLIHTDKGQHLALEKRARDYTQEWQLYKTEYGKYHVINKSNANHIQLDERGKPFPTDVNMNCPSQDFDLLPAGPGKFSIIGEGGRLLTCENCKDGVWALFEIAEDEWVETFRDDFDGEELDRSVWGVYNKKIRPDTEPVYFLDRKENFWTEDGNLVIRTSGDGYDGIPQTGAYMDTRGLYGVTYGKMEMRARLATGAWIWPAFWSMGIVGNWPYQGEIDVMELVGGGEHGELDSKLFGTLHWATEVSRHMEKGVDFCFKDYENLNDRYHTYAAEWEYDHLRLYTDDMLYMAMHLDSDGKKWGFGDNPHYLILNTSVRGPGEEKAYPETPAESLYYIDWVRCCKRAGEVTCAAEPVEDAKAPDYVNGAAREWLNKVCASPDGRYAAAAGQGGEVFVYGQHKDELLFTLREPEVAVEAITFTPDGSRLCVPNRDGEIFIYDCADFTKAPLVIDDAGTFNEFAAFTPDGRAFLAGGRDTIERGRPNAKESRVLRLWGVDGALISEAATGSDVRDAAVSADGKLAAAVCSDGSARVYELPLLTQVFRFDNEDGAAMRGVDFAPDGSLAFSDEAGGVYLCDLKKKQVRKADKVNPSSVRRVRFSPDGSSLLAVCADNCARLFDSATGKQSATLGGFAELVSEAKFSPDGKRVAVSSYDGSVRLFDGDGAYLTALRTDNPKGRWVMDIAFSADGSRLFAAMGILNTDYCVWNI